MNTPARIASIIHANDLDFSVCGIPPFHLSELKLANAPNFELPTNLRLGHLVEKIVSELIRSSENYGLRYENVQVIEDKKTVGELDFILENKNTNELIHLELAYKFYLYDPSISSESINNWIGPNRNDSLSEKLHKLKAKQLPLLHHSSTQAALGTVAIENVSQAVCLLVSLFVPYEFKTTLSPVFEKAIKGYYLNLDNFIRIHTSEKTYCIPKKKEWGIDPSKNNSWSTFENIRNQLKTSINEKQAPLIWQKINGVYSSLFIVWW